jgi:SurA-like protein
MLRFRPRFALVLLLLALVLTACGQTSAPAAAHVLGTEVTDAQVATAANVFKAFFGLQRAPCGQTSGAGDTAEAACNRYSLGALIDFRLAAAYASENGITLAEADAQKAIDGLERRIGADTLAAQLQANGASHDDFTGLLRQSLLVNEVTKKDKGAAFAAWVRQQDQAGRIDVNPSFGRYDSTSLGIVRITSTDPSATPSTQPSAGSSPSG